jgi:hypothetical protein
MTPLPILRLALVLAASALCATNGFAQGDDVDALIKEFRGESAAVVRTPDDSTKAYTRVLEALLPDMSNADAGLQGTAIETWQRIALHAARPGASAERATVARITTAKLNGQLPQITRIYLLKILERVGREEVVPALTAALDDRDIVVRDAARRALQNNPTAEAMTALRSALEKAAPANGMRAAESTPLWRAGLIDAVASRREANDDDVATLSSILGSDTDAPLVSAAITGLGEIGGLQAIQTLRAFHPRGIGGTAGRDRSRHPQSSRQKSFARVMAKPWTSSIRTFMSRINRVPCAPPRCVAWSWCAATAPRHCSSKP